PSASARQPRAVAAQEVGGLHRAAALRLDDLELERAARAAPQELPLGFHELAGSRRARRDRRAAHAEAAAVVELDPGADVRIERPHAVDQGGCTRRRVEPALLGVDLLRVGDAVVGLWMAARARVERLDEQLTAELGQPRRERPEIVLGLDRLLALEA